MIQLTLTLKVTTAQVVETSVTVINNSPIQDYVHADDQTQPTFDTLYRSGVSDLAQKLDNSVQILSRLLVMYDGGKLSRVGELSLAERLQGR